MKISDIRMDTGPDGSLCRITSTAKDYVNNIRIVKVSEEEQLKTNGPPYKLILVGEENNDSESEKSDEEISEAEKPEDRINEFKREIVKEDKVVKVQEIVQESNPRNEKSIKMQFKKRQRPKYWQRNHKNYNSSGTRNFKSGCNLKNNYNRPLTNTSTNDIEPWLNPAEIMNSRQYGIFPQYQVIMETSLNTSVNSSGNKAGGLLGDSPYPYFHHHNFQSNNQSNHFGQCQNYWNEERSSNYQRSIQDTPVSSQIVHKNYHHQNRRWKNNGRQKSSWKGNENESQKAGRKNNRYFDYRK